MSVRDGLLALLHRGPRHGYQLKSEFEAATGKVWPLNVGQVYTTLDRLQRDGFVDASERDTVSAAVLRAADASDMFLSDGIERVMNSFNAADKEDGAE